MKLKLVLLASIFALGFASTANAGAVTDTDGDLVPDQFDNCLTDPNGPNQGSNQIDTDSDGFGNACDTDYDNNGNTTTADFGVFFPAFTGTTPDLQTDHDGNGSTTTADFGTFFADFSAAPIAPGPSGLACANAANPAAGVPCVP
jgi:hypothetical protein